MIDIGYDDREMTDAYLLFKKREDVDKYLYHEKTPIARFRACDHIDFHTEETTFGGSIFHRDLERLTIRTNAILDFSRDDWILDLKANIIWRITNLTLADDGQMKELSLRPRKITYLELMRG